MSSYVCMFAPGPYLISFSRYALQLLTPASILATLAGRQQIELDDIREMGELFLDAKTSAGAISDSGIYLS